MVASMITLSVLFVGVQALLVTIVADKLSGSAESTRTGSRGFWLNQTAVMPE